MAVLVKVAWPRFTWFGDNAESFFPLWHMVGTALREGRWLGFDPTGPGPAATWWARAHYGLFNPVTLLNALVISGFDELARASFVVMTEFLVLLGLGVRSLARVYDARRAAAFTVGMIVPFGGFTLYWGAGNWICGLMSITWVTWTWWAARRYSTGAGGPLALVVFGGLAVTVGDPYSPSSASSSCSPGCRSNCCPPGGTGAWAAWSSPGCASAASRSWSTSRWSRPSPWATAWTRPPSATPAISHRHWAT